MTFAIIVKSIAIFFSMILLLVTFAIALKNFMKASAKDDWPLALFAFTPCMLNQFLLEEWVTSIRNEWFRYNQLSN